MTALKYYQDSYLQTLDAVVLSVDDAIVELDQTIFYPLGGGQPGDTGSISGANKTSDIIDTRKDRETGSIYHQLADETHGFEIGDKVTLTIDWDRRYKHMRMHSAMHLLGSLIPVPVTGGSLGAEKSRLDFDLGDYLIDKDNLTLKINLLIDEAHEVEFGEISEQCLDENPDLVRTMSVQPPRGAGNIRTVRIKDVDYQPCGGTHVNNVSEIGRVRISKIENKGKRNRRVHIVFD
jgi:misacylated tRNA(Ala) deacylase